MWLELSSLSLSEDFFFFSFFISAPQKKGRKIKENKAGGEKTVEQLSDQAANNACNNASLQCTWLGGVLGLGLGLDLKFRW